MEARTMSKTRNPRVRQVDCPRCGAAAGRFCKADPRYRAPRKVAFGWSHTERWRLADIGVDTSVRVSYL